MRCEKRGDGQGTFTDVVQHCLHLIGWLLLLIVVRFQLGTFAENHFALEETSDLSAKRRNRSGICGHARDSPSQTDSHRAGISASKNF